MPEEVSSEISPNIRLMTASDLKPVMNIETISFPDPWPRSAFEDSLGGEYHRVLIAEIEGEIAGYASYYIELKEARLTNIAVAPQFRRKSIAKKLLEYILDVVKNAGCQHIFLDVRPGNRAAISLYLKYGFYEAYRRPDYYKNPNEDALVMVRDLTIR